MIGLDTIDQLKAGARRSAAPLDPGRFVAEFGGRGFFRRKAHPRAAGHRSKASKERRSWDHSARTLTSIPENGVQR